MTAASSRLVAARVRKRGEHIQLSVRVAGSVPGAPPYCTSYRGATICRFTGSAPRLRDSNHKLKGELNGLNESYLASIQGDPVVAGNVLAKLSRMSGVYLRAVFDSQATLIRWLLNEACGTLDRPGRLHITCPVDAYLPLGLMSTAVVSERSAWTDADIAGAAINFPVFSTVVQQRVTWAGMGSTRTGGITEVLPQAHRLRRDGDGRVQTLMLWDPHAPSSSAEFRALSALDQMGQIRLFGPVPNPEYLGSDRLAAVLVNPRDVHQIPLVQLVHASAHSATDPANLESASVIWLADRRDRYDVTNGRLLEQWELLGEIRHTEGPIAVLSSCESVASVFWGIESLVRLLLGFGYRAVVGAESKVRGLLARWFSGYLYDGLLTGLSLGEAVQRARARILLEQHNPLGFLFGLYGDADLRLADNHLILQQR
jgi:hypothetical protein